AGVQTSATKTCVGSPTQVFFGPKHLFGKAQLHQVARDRGEGLGQIVDILRVIKAVGGSAVLHQACVGGRAQCDGVDLNTARNMRVIRILAVVAEQFGVCV